LIRPVILCGAETWPLRKLDEKAFLILKTKTFGPTKDEINGERKRRKNAELIPKHKYNRCIMKEKTESKRTDESCNEAKSARKIITGKRPETKWEK